MKKDFEKNIRKYSDILKGIGILEIIGGITGIGAIIWFSLQGLSTNTYVLLILLVAIGFYIYSIYAGIKLFKHKENGVIHSQIIQFLQIIAISIDGFTYLFNSGGNFSIGFNYINSNLTFKMSIIASEFEFNITSSEQNDFVYINIMAIVVLLLLEKSVITIKKQNKIKENYEQNMIEYLGKDDSNVE